MCPLNVHYVYTNKDTRSLLNILDARSGRRLNGLSLTEVVTDLLTLLTLADEILDDPERVRQQDERGRQCRSVEVLVDQVVPIIAPHLLRVLLHSLECVTMGRVPINCPSIIIVQYLTLRR